METLKKKAGGKKDEASLRARQVAEQKDLEARKSARLDTQSIQTKRQALSQTENRITTSLARYQNAAPGLDGSESISGLPGQWLLALLRWPS